MVSIRRAAFMALILAAFGVPANAADSCHASASSAIDQVLDQPENWQSILNNSVSSEPQCGALISGAMAELLPASAELIAQALVTPSGNGLSDDERLILSVIALNAPYSASGISNTFGQYLTTDFALANSLSIQAQNIVLRIRDERKIARQDTVEQFCGDAEDLGCQTSGRFLSRSSELQNVPSPN